MTVRKEEEEKSSAQRIDRKTTIGEFLLNQSYRLLIDDEATSDHFVVVFF